MNDRAHAIRILQQTRDALAQRMTERIVAAEDEILDDAWGHRYLSDINELYDELGAKLAHVNAMLAHLPECRTGQEETSSDELMPVVPDWFSADAGAGDRGAFLALPAPTVAEGAVSDPAHDLHGFLRSVHRGELAQAAALLGPLLELDLARAQRCADVFAVQAALRPELYTRVMRLKGAVQNGVLDEALGLLHDCFGLGELAAAAAVKVLQRRLGSLTNAQVQ